MTEQLISNNVRAERIAAGIETVEELAERAGIDATWCSHIEDGRVLPTRDEYERLLAALGDIPPNRLYKMSWRQLTMIDEFPKSRSDISAMWRDWRDESRLLMSRDELNYFDRQPGPDHRAQVYVNMSCGTQRSPHLLQDTVGVLEALGVDFIAAAGPGAGCCGKPLALSGQDGAFERHREGRIARSVDWGASVHVNWCGACQQTSTASAARLELADGIVHPVREIQLLPYLEETVRELGDRVPWKREARRRVLAEGHEISNVHADMHDAIPRLLAMVPGVEVVGKYDGWSELSPCAATAREGSPPPAWTQRPETPQEMADHRARLAADVRARGADTVACSHQSCHQQWSRYASDQLAVLHPVSVLAEALDCAHPDRFQAAVQHGDPRRLVDESRPRWQSWGLTEERAAEVAGSICDNAWRTQYMKEINATSVEAGRSCPGGCGGCQRHSAPTT
jgi:transcriptional regulator with XRE-family HTH domain